MNSKSPVIMDTPHSYIPCQITVCALHVTSLSQTARDGSKLKCQQRPTGPGSGDSGGAVIINLIR